jgi:hypothetical protein
MCRDYKPTVTLNGVKNKKIVRCYIAVTPLSAEPELQPGQSWWQTLPPTRTRESNRNRNKQGRTLSEECITNSGNNHANPPETVQAQMEEQIEIDLATDPWNSK